MNPQMLFVLQVERDAKDQRQGQWFVEYNRNNQNQPKKSAKVNVVKESSNVNCSYSFSCAGELAH